MDRTNCATFTIKHVFNKTWPLFLFLSFSSSVPVQEINVDYAQPPYGLFIDLNIFFSRHKSLWSTALASYLQEVQYQMDHLYIVHLFGSPAHGYNS